MSDLQGARGLLQGIGLTVSSLVAMLGVVLIVNVEWYGILALPAGLLLTAGAVLACVRLFRMR